MKPNLSVSIIDYGVGNVNSVANMLRRAGVEVEFARTSDEVLSANRLILPGVGAFDSCKRALSEVTGLEEAILSYVATGRPFLGICVGMQLLATRSEEGTLDGLNIIPGQVRKFAFASEAGVCQSLKVPHMAWSSVQTANNDPLFGGGLSDVNRFYFVHSYYFDPADQSDVSSWCRHGFEFAASVRRQNVFGVQFHPEKSQRFGMQLLYNFSQVESFESQDINARYSV